MMSSLIAMFFLAGPSSVPQFDVQGLSQTFCTEKIFKAKKWYKLPINHRPDLVQKIESLSDMFKFFITVALRYLHQNFEQGQYDKCTFEMPS